MTEAQFLVELCYSIRIIIYTYTQMRKLKNEGEEIIMINRYVAYTNKYSQCYFII